MYLCTLLIYLAILPLALCEMARRDVLQKLLDNNTYDNRIAPNYEEDRATNVTLKLSIISIDSINEISMDFSLNLFLYQTWVDPRLNFTKYSNFSSLELDQKMIENVWVPDTYFPNEKQATFHTVTVNNKLLHIYQNGTVFYSIRLSMTLTCTMKLHNFPLDDQECTIFLESYAYSIENVVFHWDTKDPVILMNAEENDQQETPQFYFYNPIATGSCEKTTSFGPNNEFACLQAKLFFRRNIGYYLAQIFVPSVLIVILSWISFWIHVDAIPARISLGVLCVLTMTTQSSGIRNSLPRVSYIKAIDVWMSTGLVFVFAALLEYAYINVQTRRHVKSTSMKGTIRQSKGPILPSNGNADRRAEVDFLQRARQVDKISRIAFPTSFLVFNIVFWTYYLIHRYVVNK
ncbi:glycine receptor subunit alpha-2-like isoform X1 [Saccostrea echinata]|uniref:glycine receptor subunit alpha-2-like isoform X1 n=2 Tax=Saccostrea echinata TaxID=191078 RepID=UPI002A83CE32|nr:glycine receptor subunit alpha-2-like isoform X1 [Saccostrea echinata]